MNTTRLGKIARLPRSIREQLNVRLDDGVPGKSLLEWLNGLPETRQVLQEQFAGKPISKQNLSKWRKGGYEEWLREREGDEVAAHLAEQEKNLAKATARPTRSDRLASVLTMELARQVREWQRDTSPQRERWRQLREMLRELADLRKEDHRAGWIQLLREKRNCEVQRPENPGTIKPGQTESNL